MTKQENLIKYLKTQFRTVELLMPKVSHRPCGKSVHQLRLATGRARVGLWVLEHSPRALRFKELGHDLRKLGKILGEVREVEVAIHDANHYGIELFDIKSRRGKAQKKIKKLVSEKKRNNLSKQFADAQNRIRKFGRVSFSMARDELIFKIRRELVLCLRGETKPHKLRIVLKKTRYALEAMGKRTGQMKLLQTVLGEEHDLVTLQTYMEKNKELKHRQHSLNDQAAPLIKPALRFALAQLDEV